MTSQYTNVSTLHDPHVPHDVLEDFYYLINSFKYEAGSCKLIKALDYLRTTDPESLAGVFPFLAKFYERDDSPVLHLLGAYRYQWEHAGDTVPLSSDVLNEFGIMVVMQDGKKDQSKFHQGLELLSTVAFKPDPNSFTHNIAVYAFPHLLVWFKREFADENGSVTAKLADAYRFKWELM